MTGERRLHRLSTIKQRERIAQLSCEGKTVAEIARELRMRVQSVSSVTRALRKEWVKATRKNVETLIAEQLAKLDHVEQEAWQAWHRSREDAVTTKAGVKGAQKTAERTVRRSAGNPVYLSRILDCIQRRCRLLGLNAPTRSDFRVLVDQLSDEEVLARAQRAGLTSPHWGKTLFLEQSEEPPSEPA